MREPKFRVWDKTLGTWADSDDFAVSCYCPRNRTGPFSMERTGSGEFDNYFGTNYVIQRFTGLTNLDKQEIFEGDIVEFGICSFSYDAGDHIDEIVFRDGRFQFKRGKYDNGEIDFENFYEFVDVIGNIFENPELLK